MSIVKAAPDFARQNYVDTPAEILAAGPGVVIDDLQGNQFQTNIQFRGFKSSPVNGVPQGLAGLQDGVRIDESFQRHRKLRFPAARSPLTTWRW